MSRATVRATSAEVLRALPGDEFIARPIASLVHAITIRRPPRDVWPWLAQMGAGDRAGWYSYDVLDNGRRPSADRIQPALQRLSVGMVFPALPGRTDGFKVVVFEPERFLVLGWPAPGGEWLVTWAFVLEACNPRATRLIVRVRAATGYRFHRLPGWLGQRLVKVVHFAMQRKQLLGIARRAEAPAAAEPPTPHPVRRSAA